MFSAIFLSIIFLSVGHSRLRVTDGLGSPSYKGSSLMLTSLACKPRFSVNSSKVRSCAS